MTGRFRPFMLGIALATLAGAAAARDYIVVNSTDPAIARGQSYDSGARVTLAPGRALTLMHASGDLVRLKGASGAVLLPRRQTNQAEADRLAIHRVIVAPADRQPASGMRPMRMRAGVCPEAAKVTTLDAIVQVHQGGCAAEAALAFEAWIAAHPPADD
jgi:hypothetical protein